MSCQSCNSNRIASISAECKDLCHIVYASGCEHEGYVPVDMNIGGDDEIFLDLCLDCGHVQGHWPLAYTDLETGHQRSQQPSKVMINPLHRDYIDRLQMVAGENQNSGINAVWPVLLDDVEDPEKIITGVAVLLANPLTNLLAQGLVDALDEWEHAERLYQVIAEIDPQHYGDD